MTHDQNARKNFGCTLETLVRRILATFDEATVTDLEAGARWYPKAGAICASLASPSWSIAEVAAVVSHLSPRTSWDRNIAGATAMVTREDDGDDEARRLGMIGENVERAIRCVDFEDPFDSFGPKAHKTRSFYLNILGDVEAVTIDVWAMRVAGIDDDRLLKRVGAYQALEHAYRLAARRRGVDPSTMQATTWVVARNGRSS